jgi:hypothetical protein
MSAVFSWIAQGLAALMFVAVIVAWWEHLGRVERRRSLVQDPEAARPTRTRVLSVDVDLEVTPAPVVLEGDAATRREVLDGALSRMSREGSTAASRSAWIDTAPMIGQGMGTPETAARSTPAPAPTPQEQTP